MRIIAIDPGFDRMGVAVLEKKDGKEILLFSECVITERNSPFSDRIGGLTTNLKNTILEWKPDYCAFEKLFFSKNQKTAMKVAEARGALMEVAHSLGVKILEFAPTEVKLAVTSSGAASKGQVADMVKRLIKLSHTPKYDDEYDAIAIGLTAFASLRNPQIS